MTQNHPQQTVICNAIWTLFGQQATAYGRESDRSVLINTAEQYLCAVWSGKQIHRPVRPGSRHLWSLEILVPQTLKKLATHKASTNGVQGSSSLPVSIQLHILSFFHPPVACEGCAYNLPFPLPLTRLFFLLILQSNPEQSKSYKSITAALLHVVGAFSNSVHRAKHTYSQYLVAGIQGVFPKDHHLLLLSQNQ